MINYFENIFSPIVGGEIDVYDFLDRMSNPDSITKDSILEARSLKKNGDEDGYQKIKKSLACYTLNFSFDGKKSNDTIKKPTGFIYLDVDNVPNIDLSNPYIFAAWSSISGRGLGVLVKIDGLTLENFKLNYKAIGEALNITVDYNAAKPTQYTIQSYDENLYINNDSTTWVANNPVTPTSLAYKKKKARYVNERGANETINYDNLHELDFNGQDYLIFADEKYMAAKAFSPRKILAGKRNQTLFTFGAQFKALNPNISPSYLSKKIHGMNSYCEPPLPKKEVNQIISNIIELDNLEPFLNYPRRVIFNPEALLTKAEKDKVRGRVIGDIKLEKTCYELALAVLCWDYCDNNRVTQRKLAAITKKNIKTIERHYRNAKNLALEMERGYEEYCKKRMGLDFGNW